MAGFLLNCTIFGIDFLARTLYTKQNYPVVFVEEEWLNFNL
jgi:hypothetical protein